MNLIDRSVGVNAMVAMRCLLGAPVVCILLDVMMRTNLFNEIHLVRVLANVSCSASCHAIKPLESLCHSKFARSVSHCCVSIVFVALRIPWLAPVFVRAHISQHQPCMAMLVN
jgi:hypothetical protein